MRRKFDSLENLDLPFPGLIPWFEVDDDLKVVEDLLEERLPSSLKGLVLNRLLHVDHVIKITEAMVHLKLQGVLPHLEGLLLKFGDPLAMRMLGIPPLTLDEIEARMKKHVGPIFSRAKLKLEFEESE